MLYGYVLMFMFCFLLQQASDVYADTYWDQRKMRSILLDWPLDVHVKFDLSPETLYLTINIIDLFLSLKTIPRESYSF